MKIIIWNNWKYIRNNYRIFTLFTLCAREKKWFRFPFKERKEYFIYRFEILNIEFGFYFEVKK